MLGGRVLAQQDLELPYGCVELLLALLGNAGLGWEGDAFSEEELAAVRQWASSKTLTIAGGTSEIQLNIIAKRALGLPS